MTRKWRWRVDPPPRWAGFVRQRPEYDVPSRSGRVSVAEEGHPENSSNGNYGDSHPRSLLGRTPRVERHGLLSCPGCWRSDRPRVGSLPWIFMQVNSVAWSHPGLQDRGSDVTRGCRVVGRAGLGGRARIPAGARRDRQPVTTSIASDPSRKVTSPASTAGVDGSSSSRDGSPASSAGRAAGGGLWAEGRRGGSRRR